MEIKNKKAYFDYFILEEIEAGLVLVGTEIKSIKAGTCNLKDSFAYIKKDEAYIINMFIGKYESGNQFNHEERRSRKVLLHKKEIKKLKEKMSLEGCTLIPLKIYLKYGKAKVLLGVCKGKKNFDKRKSIKEREAQREIKKLY